MVTVPDRPNGSRSRGLGAVVYVSLFVLGAVEGIVGSFQYGQSPVPLIALVLAFLILVTCVFGGWGAGSLGGSLAPAAGWLLASFILSMGSRGGSVIITNSTGGEWYHYGGTLAVVVGVLATFILQTTTRLMSAR
jgi:hypothetical protein